MNNYPWQHQRRFNAYVDHLKQLFGQRVQKLSIDAGFTCPNRDGKVGTGGCTYCNNDAFNPSYCIPSKSVTQQLTEGIEFHQNRYRNAENYLAFFQTYSNTYGSLEVLKEKINEALSLKSIKGIIVSTRPDCIDDEKLDYFEELSKTKYVSIEYGVESCFNSMLEKINRGHSYEQSIEAIEKTAVRGINVGGHLMLGLPGESRVETLNQAKIISKLPIKTIKIHQLQIIENTKMAEEFRSAPENFNLFSIEEYIEFVIDFLELLNPDFMIERLVAEVPPRFLVAPHWGRIRSWETLRLIEKRMEERDSWQGKKF